ncbi:DUF4259 domain-containing protein [Microbacterium sp. P04]|uniref:DUF4259 domain-containing protein n=1 Tax=Microbacterium sp. P04 TaxID=3366947 RepID=UPI00374523B7
MGAWSGEPFGNDVAADWAWDLEEADDWTLVRTALEDAITPDAVDERTAVIALAAAEVVAHGLGRPTQDDAYTGELSAFVSRASAPSDEIVALAIAAVERASDPDGDLARTWEECGNEAWLEAVHLLARALDA